MKVHLIQPRTYSAAAVAVAARLGSKVSCCLSHPDHELQSGEGDDHRGEDHGVEENGGHRDLRTN